MYESAVPVIEKYGRNCKLNQQNIKDIYFIGSCNNAFCDSEITDFLEKHYSAEEILRWNDEFINTEIDKCYRLIKNRDWESISTIGLKIYELGTVFTYERKTYLRIIEFLKKFYETYGYFMNYSCIKLKSTYPYEDKSFYPLLLIYVFYRRTDRLESAARSTGAEYRYLKDDGYRGLIPRLYKLKYNDILDKLLVEVIVPIFEHFCEESDIMKENNIEYLMSDKTVEEYSLRVALKRYYDEFNISAPEQIKKYL